MITDKVTTYHKAVHETLGGSKKRMNEIMNEAWFPKKKETGNEAVITVDQAVKLTKSNKGYFLNVIQMMLDILRLQYNREYLEDFGQPRSATYVFEYDPNLQEITLYVSMKIKGISNRFLFQTSTVFRLDVKNKIVKAIGDEFLYMIALIGSKQQIHSKNNIREILNSLPSGSTSSKSKQFYRKTEQRGPAQGLAAKQTQTNDNTIRL